MSRCVFVGFSRLFMASKECLAPDRTHEVSERAVCELNTCLEQLTMRRDDIETKIATCTTRASAHALSARRETSQRAQTRALELARQHLSDRRALRGESDRLTHSIATLVRNPKKWWLSQKLYPTVTQLPPSYVYRSGRWRPSSTRTSTP